MGDSLKKTTRRGLKLASGAEIAERAGKAIEKPIRTGASAARRDAAGALKEQQQKESLMLAEKESEIAEKRAMAKSGRGGRQSLIKSASGGLATTLGG
tara:strand:+ start:150 stop:443 length:294 start_codon:yes stop_codon:yes gene_type:complete